MTIISNFGKLIMLIRMELLVLHSATTISLSFLEDTRVKSEFGR